MSEAGPKKARKPRINVMEATSSTEGAPWEDPAHVEASNGGGVPTNYRDESDKTSDVEDGMVATHLNRERMQEEVAEVLGIMLPPGAGLPDGFPAVFTSSTDASDPTGTRHQGVQRVENLDILNRTPGDTLHDPTLGVEERVSRVQGPDHVQRLQQVAIARLCHERDQLRRQLAEAQATLPVAVAAERDRLEGLEVRAVQLGRECERLRREGEGLWRRWERWEAAMVVQATFIALIRILEPDPRDDPEGPESQQ